MVAETRAREDFSPEAADFIRFCYRRRRVGWPEIYDEMCAVAGRGLFHGWTHDDLADHGIGFSLSALPALAAQVRRIVDEEPARMPPILRGRGRSQQGDGGASADSTPVAGEPASNAAVA